jgi:hypothetical protein
MHQGSSPLALSSWRLDQSNGEGVRDSELSIALEIFASYRAQRTWQPLTDLPPADSVDFGAPRKFSEEVLLTHYI